MNNTNLTIFSFWLIHLYEDKLLSTFKTTYLIKKRINILNAETAKSVTQLNSFAIHVYIIHDSSVKRNI